jgi:hypothetical protein
MSKVLIDRKCAEHFLEAELLQRIHQMQDELLQKDRDREKDKEKYKVETERQYEQWRRKAELEIQQKKDDFEKVREDN